MTSTMNSSTQGRADASLASPAPAAPVGTPRKHSAGHIIAIVVGCLMVLPGFGMLAGGSALAIAQVAATDDDGYFRFTLDRVESDGAAVATTSLWFEDVDDEAGPWVLDWLDLDLRLRVEGAADTDDVFVGIARSADVERFLSGTAYSEVVELDDRTPEYRQVTGVVPAGSPLAQDFWTVSASGSGEQELTWEARGGRWSVVVMNADGSPDVAADIEVGARSDAVTPITITLIVVGGITTTLAIVLFVIGVRGRRTPAAPAVDARQIQSPFPPPSRNTSAQPHDGANEETDETEIRPGS